MDHSFGYFSMYGLMWLAAYRCIVTAEPAAAPAVAPVRRSAASANVVAFPCDRISRDHATPIGGAEIIVLNQHISARVAPN